MSIGSGDKGETLFFTCAGAAHSGQVANRAGNDLMRERVGNLFCIAAVGADVPEKMARARRAAQRVVIDGCEDHCARKIMEKADVHVEVTQLGIEKMPAKPRLVKHSKQVAEHVRRLLTP